MHFHKINNSAVSSNNVLISFWEMGNLLGLILSYEEFGELNDSQTWLPGLNWCAWLASPGRPRLPPVRIALTSFQGLIRSAPSALLVERVTLGWHKVHNVTKRGDRSISSCSGRGSSPERAYRGVDTGKLIERTLYIHMFHLLLLYVIQNAVM